MRSPATAPSNHEKWNGNQQCNATARAGAWGGVRPDSSSPLFQAGDFVLGDRQVNLDQGESVLCKRFQKRVFGIHLHLRHRLHQLLVTVDTTSLQVSPIRLLAALLELGVDLLEFVRFKLAGLSIIRGI